MTRTGLEHERRSESRERAAARRLAWAREESTEANTGWVSEVAASGIAFTTPTRDRPAPGDVIELTLEPGGPFAQRRRVRVARTGRYDRFFSVVGCRDEPLI